MDVAGYRQAVSSGSLIYLLVDRCSVVMTAKEACVAVAGTVTSE